jgi:hypothetical protein
METRTHLLKKYVAKSAISSIVSITDLREKEFNGEPLTVKEKQALKNFDHFRISELNAQQSETEFHKRYQEIQVMANLGSYEEFLQAKYFQ